MFNVFSLSNVKFYFRSGEYLEIPKEIFRNLKCCFQRITKGYCFRDIWSIDNWFLNVIPDMLDEYRDSTNGYPSSFLKNDDSDTAEERDRAFEKWKGILTEMTFLFREANEETCQRKNPYAEEHANVLHKFFERFGFNGKWVKKKDGTRVFIYRMSDIPKYKALDENYHRVEHELWEYREDCRKKAMSMFTEYFHELWY